MAQTQRKAVYIQPKHHKFLKRIACEQDCNISDVLDKVLEQMDWEEVVKQIGIKSTQNHVE